MRLLTGALAALLFTGVTSAPAWAQRTEERIDRTFAFQPGGTLRLKTFSGTVEIRGTDASQVVVHAVRRATAEKLRDITFDIDASASEIVIEANRHDRGRRDDNVVEADIRIEVPAETRLDVKTFSAPVTVTGVAGAQQIGGFSGTIRIDGLAQGAEIKTFSGDVTVAASRWPDGQSLEIDTFSGAIDLRVPADARAELAFNTFSGDLESDLPITLTRARGRRNLTGTLNGGGSGRLRLKTFSGDAHVR
ncbi:MAG: DUF4097 family beta strand repeat-containing protein [Vicinamibacterales bacterium]